ncbi:hypothetical protein NDU88_002169 [Pleurodeles waltl]|uniref:Uncharacterized protein n=1 Tax=Pleurodeles waltl TaxID=8319 RepID=A0AAV7T2I4_PLEWA|nr:hypothetical protein NDU88_002169 [Pleurodeles waltl]
MDTLSRPHQHSHSDACRRGSPCPRLPGNKGTRCLDQALHPQPQGQRGTTYQCRSDQQVARILAQSVTGRRSPPCALPASPK